MQGRMTPQPVLGCGVSAVNFPPFWAAARQPVAGPHLSVVRLAAWLFAA